MAKDLHAAIRLRKWEVDEKRRAMGELLRQEADIIAHQKQLEQELMDERKAATESEDAGFVFAAYYKRYQRRRDQLAAMLKTLQASIMAAQDALTEAFKELKTMEISQKNRDKRAAEELARKTQAELDEIAMNLHRRKKLGLD